VEHNRVERIPCSRGLTRHRHRKAISSSTLGRVRQLRSFPGQRGVYSLFGLRGINLPLLFCEGDKAFVRLQIELIRQSADETVLMWAGGVRNGKSQLGLNFQRGI